MKKLSYLLAAVVLAVTGCSSVQDSDKGPLNTENSIVITGINESISYSFQSADGRVEGSIPDDINMLQILILNEDEEVVYEQYHYNQNAYNDHYYDSAGHGGDDYMFENTIPDTLYIPPLEDGTYSVLASTVYASYYDYHYESDSMQSSYPIIESYHVSDAPIFVGKATAVVTQDADAFVEIDMNNISSRIDLNVTTSREDWGLEIHMESGNSHYYSFESEDLEPVEYDYDNLYLWNDSYWRPEAFYFLPRDFRSVSLWFYDHSQGINLNYELDIDPDLNMAIGDVFTLSIDLDELVEGGGSASLSWEEVDWNDVGEVTIP